jgi:cytochrome c oxidase subunit 3
MATSVHEPPKIRPVGDPARLKSGGGNGSGTPTPGGSVAVREYAPPPASTGIWVVIAAICMMFLAFTSALIVRKGGALDWQHFTLPWILYLNTLVLLASSVTLQIARHRFAVVGTVPNRTTEQTSRWLYATLLLGLAFVAGQYIAWRELRAEGLYLATNPSSSFFYVFTVAHALHLLGGLAGLGRVTYKLNHSVLRRSTLDATARYWHFMDFLWVYLLLLLWMKI